METIQRKYTQAVVFTTDNAANNLDQYARAQLQMLCDNPCQAGSRIRVMPDVHPGKVGTIGLTMAVGEKLDSIIKNDIPAGFQVRRRPHNKAVDFDYNRLCCKEHIRTEKARLALGTLGSGNHFIEVDTDGESLYLVIHSGSRILGKEVTEHYLSLGQAKLKARGLEVPYELTWLEGKLKAVYHHDTQIVQEYAELNRQIMISEIIKGMKWKADEVFSCHHNRIALDELTLAKFGAPVLRKGAVSAQKGERVVIPINMGDGIILGTGLGNEEWNCSAPHGAGRILKREDVGQRYTTAQYKAAMKGVHSISVNSGTLDEAPFAYRSLEEIERAVAPTVKIEKILTPLYNFKAGDRR